MKIQPGTGHIFTSSSEGFSIDTSEQFPSSDISGKYHPLQAYGFRKVSGTSTILFRVYPGTINNLVPQIEVDTGTWRKLDYQSGGVPYPPEGVLNTTSGYYYIYLQTGVDPDGNSFPDSSTSSDYYPRIICFGVQQTDSDAYGYILLAHGHVDADDNVFNYQDVTGSLWADRIKLGTQTATYYYARI